MLKSALFLIAAFAVGLAHAQPASTPAAAPSAAPTTQAPAKAPAKSSAAKADAHRAENIAKHQQMSQTHAEAARCLESGKAESACQDALRAACKGIAIGQYCGMRHGH
jgi:hypothetical protein